MCASGQANTDVDPGQISRSHQQVRPPMGISRPDQQDRSAGDIWIDPENGYKILLNLTTKQRAISTILVDPTAKR